MAHAMWTVDCECLPMSEALERLEPASGHGRTPDLTGTSHGWTLLARGTFRGRRDCSLLGVSLLRVGSLLGFLFRVLAHSAHDSISCSRTCGEARPRRVPSGCTRAIARAMRTDAIISSESWLPRPGAACSGRTRNSALFLTGTLRSVYMGFHPGIYNARGARFLQ
jgi:hypothetical protein